MARIQPTPGAGDDAADPALPESKNRRKAVRYAVPVAVAGVAAATIGIGSALASAGDPELPKISAQDLIAKMAASDVQQLSGSVRITSDLGIPALPSGMSLGQGGLGGERHGKGDKGDKGSAAAPDTKLTELAAGTHTLRVAADGPQKQRVSIVERTAEYSLIHNGDQVWAYDSGSNTAYHSTAPGEQGAPKHQAPKDLAGATPQELAKKMLAAVDDTTSVAVDGTAKVAGRDAYQLTIKPKQSETTVGAVRIAVDAKNGVPLKFTLTPKGGGKAAVDAAFTKVSFGKPGASAFTFTPPKGAKVTEGKPGRPGAAEHGREQQQAGPKVIGKGWTSVVEITGGKAMDKGALPGARQGADKAKQGGGASALLDSFGTKVSGPFGSGRLVSTRLVNVLLTDDGKVYAGAVTKDALLKAAGGK